MFRAQRRLRSCQTAGAGRRDLLRTERSQHRLWLRAGAELLATVQVDQRRAAVVVYTRPIFQPSLAIFLKELFRAGKTLLLMFLGFAFIGYFLNGLIPASWVAAIFGSGNIYNVPLAATLGLPFYINSEASLAVGSGAAG